MGFFDFLKSKKKKQDEVSNTDAEAVIQLDGSELAGLEPPETRFTEEYREFLASQETGERSAPPADAAVCDAGGETAAEAAADAAEAVVFDTAADAAADTAAYAEGDTV